MPPEAADPGHHSHGHADPAPTDLMRRLAHTVRADHAAASVDGTCRTCHHPVPCPAAQLATTALGLRPSPDEATLVDAAIDLLAPFETSDPEQAMALLSWWPRYDQLSPADIHAILSHYRAPCVHCGQDRHHGTEDHGLARRCDTEA